MTDRCGPVARRGSPGSRAVHGRQRAIAEIFGDVLPATTRDEREEATLHTAESDRWYHDNRPPHHDQD